MESSEVRQRKQPAAEEASELLKHSSKPPTEPRLKHGVPMQILRSLLLAAWFNCCCIVIFVTQLVGSPLYLINKDWYYSYMAYTKQNFGLVITALTDWGAPTLFRVSGDASVRGQLHVAEDGMLQTSFPERVVLIANHQVYTDWIYLWWVAYTNAMHGRIYIILKESLKYIPVVGQGMMFYGFVFMARKWLSDKPRLQHRLEKLKTRHAGSKSGHSQFDPMWLLIFPEGTNLSLNTKRRSDEYGQKQGYHPFKHEILPRSTGLFFCLQQLRGTVDWVYDSTIAYEGPPYVLISTSSQNKILTIIPERAAILTSTLLSARPMGKADHQPRSTCTGDGSQCLRFPSMTSKNLTLGSELGGLRKTSSWTTTLRLVVSHPSWPALSRPNMRPRNRRGQLMLDMWSHMFACTTGLSLARSSWYWLDLLSCAGS